MAKHMLSAKGTARRTGSLGSIAIIAVLIVAAAAAGYFILRPGASDGTASQSSSVPDSGAEGTAAQSFSGVIKIAAAGPYTGDLSKIGLDSLNAIKLAVEDVNARGGIAGRKVEVVVGDDAGDPSKGVITAEKLVADKEILGVVGPMNSGVVNAALPTYDAAGLAIISQSASTNELTERGYHVMFRVCARDDAQGKYAAKFILEELKPRSVYVVDDKTLNGISVADNVIKFLKDGGLANIERGQVASEDKDFFALLTKIKSAKPDLVYLAFASPSQAAAFVKQMADVGVKAKIMASDGVREKDQFIAGSAGLAEGAYVTTIGKELRQVEAAQDFIQRFEAKHGAMSIFSGQSYEATMILLEAIERAAAKGELTRQAVLDEVRATDGYEGILGFPIKFDERGDLVGGSVFVLQVKGDDFVQVKEYRIGVD